MKYREEKDELLINYLSGSASEQERREAINYIRASEENKAHFEELKHYYQISLLAAPFPQFNKQEGWARVRVGYYKQLYAREKQKNAQNFSVLIKRIALPIAASLLIAFLIGALVQYNIFGTSNPDLAFNEIKAPYGARSIVTLPDSTTVWLNAGSTLRYPSNFSGKNREVYLEGEAFFDVTKNEKNIFRVNAGDIRINVYGTQFNVKAYTEEQEVTTTLVSGSISIDVINLTTPKAPLILKPNQSVTITKAVMESAGNENNETSADYQANADTEVIEKITILSAEPRVLSSWKDSVWVIRGEELGKLAVVLERRFNVKISFEEESLKKYKFSGSLIEETFEQVMKIIRTSAPINFSVENNHVIIKEDKLFKERYDSQLRRN